LERRLDFADAAVNNVRVVVNLRHGWSTDKGGQGTLPPSPQWEQFAEACLWCIGHACGVWGWSIGNEYNNRREWPRGQALTPSYVAAVYDHVAMHASAARTAPGAVDPYYGPGSDCGLWFEQVWRSIRGGADFVDLHGYIRGPDPDLCWSEARFGSEPLTWQGLNYWHCCATLLARLPSQYRNLPVLVSECNHLWKTVEPDWGWVNDDRAGDVVRALYDRAREWNAGGGQQVAGLCLYRWRGDEWAVADNGHVLGALADV